MNSSKLIDGKFVSQSILNTLKQKIQSNKSVTIPGLAVVLAGDRKDSICYVKMKQRAAESIGMYFELHHHPSDVTEKELLYCVQTLNHNPRIHGIIVQLPLPDHINKNNIISEVNLLKDVDGFHALNIGKLALDGYTPDFSPCTPKGVMKLLKHYNVELSGKRCVVLGKSNIVGLPMALMLLNEGATVTICDHNTPCEDEITREADVLISATGVPRLVKSHWIKEGAVVIDIGINTVVDSSKKKGYRLVGDVDFENVIDKARLITPVPGGIGPMTVAMLMQSTYDSFERLSRKD